MSLFAQNLLVQNLLAHNGVTTWDELLLFVAPFILAAVIFVWGRRNARDVVMIEREPD